MAIGLEQRIIRFVTDFGTDCLIGPRLDEITDHLVRAGFCTDDIHAALYRLRRRRKLTMIRLHYEGRDYGHYEVRRG